MIRHFFYSLVYDGQILCAKLTVTGNDPYNTGSYIISEERASKSPDKPVYKLEGKDKYIYHNPDMTGWRIGKKNRLSGEKEGYTWYRSKFSFTIGRNRS